MDGYFSIRRVAILYCLAAKHEAKQLPSGLRVESSLDFPRPQIRLYDGLGCIHRRAMMVQLHSRDISAFHPFNGNFTLRQLPTHLRQCLKTDKFSRFDFVSELDDGWIVHGFFLVSDQAVEP